MTCIRCAGPVVTVGGETAAMCVCLACGLITTARMQAMVGDSEPDKGPQTGEEPWISSSAS